MWNTHKKDKKTYKELYWIVMMDYLTRFILTTCYNPNLMERIKVVS